MRCRSLQRFRLRTLLLLVLALGVPLAAWRAWVEPYRVQRAAMRAIADAGGSYETEAGGPAWLRSLFGEAWFQDVVRVDLRRGADADVLQHVFELPRLSCLDVSGRAFTDRHLARLVRLAELKEAVLTSTSVSRESVEAFEQARPDVALRIGLSFDELTGLLADEPPDSVRQWEGRRVQVVGVFYPLSAIWVTEAELRPQDVTVPPRWSVAVTLRSPIKARDCIWAFAETTAEGRLDIAAEPSDHGTAVYRLRDATLSPLELPN